MSHNYESEITFLVSAENPNEVLKSISELTTITGYTLQPGGMRKLHDRYFDTSGRIMKQRQFSLRFREIKNDVLIAFKGKSKVQNGVSTKIEIEDVFGEVSLRKILSELKKEFPAVIPESYPPFDPTHPVKSLSQLGFEVVQERKTARQVRHIVDNRNNVLAELVLDTVHYAVPTADGERIFVHREVEIEQESEGDFLGVLKDALLNMFGNVLSICRFSKYAIGEKIQEFYEEGKLLDVLSDENLNADAYRMIFDRLEAEEKGISDIS